MDKDNSNTHKEKEGRGDRERKSDKNHYLHFSTVISPKAYIITFIFLASVS